MSWKITPHTADLVIEADGKDAGDCLDAAGLALTSVLTGDDAPHGLGANEEVSFHVEAPDDQALAVAFLSELLWITESKDLLWTGGGVTVQVLDDGMRRATVQGNTVRFDKARHGRGIEVKAVTYHGIRFEQDGPHWALSVLLDI